MLALSGSILLLLFLAAVFGAVFIVFDVVGSLAEGKCGLLGFVLVVFGVSWLLGGEDDDPDCRFDGTPPPSPVVTERASLPRSVEAVQAGPWTPVPASQGDGRRSIGTARASRRRSA